MSSFDTIFKKLKARVETLSSKGSINFDLDDNNLNFFANEQEIKKAKSSIDRERDVGSSCHEATQIISLRDVPESGAVEKVDDCKSSKAIAIIGKRYESRDNNDKCESVTEIAKSDVAYIDKLKSACYSTTVDSVSPEATLMRTKGTIIQWNIPVHDYDELMFIDSFGNLVDAEDLTHSAVNIFDTVYEFCGDGILETPSAAFQLNPGTLVVHFETIRTKEEFQAWIASQQYLFSKERYDAIYRNDIHFSRCILGFLGVMKQPEEWSRTMYSVQQIFSTDSDTDSQEEYISDLRNIYVNFSGRSLNIKGPHGPT